MSRASIFLLRFESRKMIKQKIFDQPELQKAYEEYNKQERIRLLKIGCWLVIVGMPAGVSLDQSVYPEHLKYFLVLRLACALLGLTLLGLWFTSFGVRYNQIFSPLLPLLPLGFISWMIY